MSGVVLASLIGRGDKPVKPPTLIKAYDYTQKAARRRRPRGRSPTGDRSEIADPAAAAVSLLAALLAGAALLSGRRQVLRHAEEPSANGAPRRRGDLRLHFAKTGTSVTHDPNATVDTWIAGGLQFSERRRLFLRRACRHRHGVASPGHTICTPRRSPRRCSTFCSSISPSRCEIESATRSAVAGSSRTPAAALAPVAHAHRMTRTCAATSIRTEPRAKPGSAMNSCAALVRTRKPRVTYGRGCTERTRG